MYYSFHEFAKLNHSVTCIVEVAIDHIFGCCDNIKIAIPQVYSIDFFVTLKIYNEEFIHNHSAQATL